MQQFIRTKLAASTEKPRPDPAPGGGKADNLRAIRRQWLQNEGGFATLPGTFTLSMLRYYYEWRHRRADRTAAFRMPVDDPRLKRASNFGNYLAQNAVRGRSFARFDMARRRRQYVRLAVACFIVVALGWLAYESFTALAFLAN